MQHYCGVCLVALVAVVCFGAFVTGVAADTTAPSLRIAVVDVKRVNEVFVKPQAKTNDLEQWANQQQQYLDELQTRYVYLGQEAFGEVLDILRMPRPLAAKPAKRQRELREVNDSNEGRFLELQAKVDRTPQEQDEFNRLQANLEAREKQIKDIVDALQVQLDERQKQNHQRVMEAVQKAITEAATEGGYALVINKFVVLYGGEDITDTVLAKLTGQPAAGTEAATPATSEPGGGQ